MGSWNPVVPVYIVDSEVKVSGRLGTIWIMIISISHASLHPESQSGQSCRYVVTAKGPLELCTSE